MIAVASFVCFVAEPDQTGKSLAFQLLPLPTSEHPRLFASTRLLNYKHG